MRTRFVALLTASALLASTFGVSAQQKKPDPRKGRAESRLLGIPLYTKGVILIQKFGSPDEIQPLSLSTTNSNSGGGQASGGEEGSRGAAPPGPPSNAGGGAGTPSGGKRRPGGRSASSATGPMIGDPFDTTLEFRQGGAQAPGIGEDGGEGSARRGGGGAPASGSGGSESSEKVEYTRWIYNRKAGRYAFVMDKYNQVVQIEAIGLSDPKVKTARGVSFGSSFGDLIRKYGSPDGYEISGDNLVVRYLVRDKVAFRLSRLEAKKPHRVTGIVVAAGK